MKSIYGLFMAFMVCANPMANAKELSWKNEDLQVKVGGQFRYRLELRDDFNFNDATFEDDAINLLRTRLDVELKLGKSIRVFAQGQDSESFANREAHKSRLFVNRLDLHQFYLEFKSPVQKLPLSVKVGRQKLAYGDQRFVGGFEWSNVARVFDAVKLAYKPEEWFQLDTWFSRVVRINRSQPDSAQHDDNFYGIYATLKGPREHALRDHLLDTFLFVRHNTDNEAAGEVAGRRGQLKEYTIGNRFKGKKWDFDYGTEWAIQRGSRAHEDIQAWAFHQSLGYTIPKLPWKPRLSFEYNHGSGDGNSTDGKIKNFDNLFPTNHLHYGYMDFVSLRNTDNVKLGFDVTPKKGMKFIFAYHWFFLDEPNSALFNAGQAPIRAGNPRASKTVGKELDLLLKWKVNRHFHFLMGYSHFFAGGFLEDTGAHSDADFFYVQPTISF